MSKRLGFMMAAITAVLLVTGIAWAAQDLASSDDGNDDRVTDTTSSTNPTNPTSSTASTSLTTAVTSAVDNGGTTRIAVADAGSVELRRNGASLEIVSTSPNPGWSVEVEGATGREVEGDFRNGNRRVKFNFELEDGQIRVRIEERDGSTAATSSTSSTSSTSTTNGQNSGSRLPTGSVTYSLGAAGSITVNFAEGTMTLVSTNPAPGWTVAETEAHGDEIEVELRNGELETEIKVEIENGQVRVEVESKD